MSLSSNLVQLPPRGGRDLPLPDVTVDSLSPPPRIPPAPPTSPTPAASSSSSSSSTSSRMASDDGLIDVVTVTDDDASSNFSVCTMKTVSVASALTPSPSYIVLLLLCPLVLGFVLFLLVQHLVPALVQIFLDM